MAQASLRQWAGMLCDRVRGGRPEGLSLWDGGGPLDEEDPAMVGKERRRLVIDKRAGDFLLGIAMVRLLMIRMTSE